MTFRPRAKRAPSRVAAPLVSILETRTLLAGPQAVWVGQDGHDLVGPYPALSPDGIQDVHIRLTNLPTERTIASLDLRGLGGGQWVDNSSIGPWRAAVERTANSADASVFIEPDRNETGRPFNLVLTFDDGSAADIWFSGGLADPNLRSEAGSLSAEWLGQTGEDRTGPTAAVGPDGWQDALIQLIGLSPNLAITAVRITGPLGKEWVSGRNPQGRANAELIRDAADPSARTIYFSPDRDLNGETLTVDVEYATNQVDEGTVGAGDRMPNLRSLYPTPFQPSSVASRAPGSARIPRGQSDAPIVRVGWESRLVGFLRAVRSSERR